MTSRGLAVSSSGQEPKPYRILARVRNNRLWVAILRAFPKVRTMKDAAKALGENYSAVVGLCGMRRWPFSERDQQWRKIAKRIASKLRDTPEYLFDPELYGRRPAAQVEVELGPAELQAAGILSLPPAPDEIVERQDLTAAIEAALGLLTAREREVLELRYGLGPVEREHTLAEIAAKWGRSVERVRQIEMKALRRLRHPRGAKHLRETR